MSAFFLYTGIISGQGKHHRQEAPRYAPAALSGPAAGGQLPCGVGLPCGGCQGGVSQHSAHGRADGAPHLPEGKKMSVAEGNAVKLRPDIISAH